MFRIILVQILFLCCLGSISSQTVPNFVLNDINGNSHNLYSYLNEDKVVIIDVFATWCSNCWTLHKEDKLKHLYSTYGPDGTDQLMILFIEGDLQTANSTLFDNPFGDWTKDVPYPIFNPNGLDDSFIEAFSSDGVPTTNVICPRTRENIADAFAEDLSEIIEIIQDCNTISNVSDLQILGAREVTKPICLNSNIEFSVLNTGTSSIDSFFVSAIDSDGFTISSELISAELLPGEEIDINLGEFNLPQALVSDKASIQIETLDDVVLNNAQEVTFIHAPEVFNELTLRIVSDFWAVEDNTRWWIENSEGDRVTGVNLLESLGEFEESFFLENNDCFTFVIVDDFGDGMVLGSILLTDDQGNVLFDDSNFGDRGEASFEYVGSAVTSTEQLNGEEYALDLVPSVSVIDQLQIQYAVHREGTSITLYDSNGSLLQRFPSLPIALDNKLTIDVHNLPTGVYIVSMQNPEGVLTKRFIKQ